MLYPIYIPYAIRVVLCFVVSLFEKQISLFLSCNNLLSNFPFSRHQLLLLLKPEY